MPVLWLLVALFAASEEKKDGADDYLKYAIPKDAKVTEHTARPGYEYVVYETYRMGDETVGITYYWDRNKNQLHSEELFKGGKQHGAQRAWHGNGQLRWERPYKDGQMHGTFTQSDKSGKLLGTFVMKEGTGNFQTWYDNGRLEYIKPYKKGKEHGELRTFYDNGILFQAITYKEGKAHGISYLWERSGMLTNDSPKFYIQDERVTKEEYLKAAEKDKSLAPIKASDGDK
jgi:antitoxin component YwqK of YwqJK toxin-antitoxin module